MKHFLNRRVIVLVIALGLTLPTSSAADQTRDLSLDEVLLNLKTRQETLTTFIADFKQVQQNELFAEPQTSSGTLYFDRVGKLLIKMRQPEPYVVLLTDGKMISGVPGSPFGQKKLPGGKTALQKTLGMDRSLDQLKKQFRIRMSPNPGQHLYTLEFRPLKVNRRMPYSNIEAVVDDQMWLPINLLLVEPGGDSVRFIFQYTAINSALPQDIFDIGPIDAGSSPSDNTHEIK